MAGDKQLLHSVLHYLQKNQFSKSLTRLLKEAKIEGHTWEDKALDLEDIYNKYLQSCNNVEVKSKNIQEQAIQGEGNKESQEDAAAAQEINGKKKKKKTANLENVRESKVDEKVTEPHAVQTTETENTVDVTNNKKKKQKKNKLVTESIVEDEKKSDTKSGLPEEKPKASLPEETTNTKEKKKKNKSTTEPLTGINASVGAEVDTIEKKTKKQAKEKKSLEPADIGADDSQISKKRKRSASDESEVKPADETTVKESKRRKPEGAEVDDKQIVSNGETTIDDPLKLSKNGSEKSGPKQPRHGSAEPKTINAFQRVKIDEVEFVDDRLTDNSYWAKEGAEIGYGAKAQEILGQVKGRDFRHEKTKKKRGSYRGGLIDQGSHSFKYNYSDDE